MKDTDLTNLTLEDGSTICVIGGGPSGSFFSYFALTQATRFGIDIKVDIYEAKDFNCLGPDGCNHCGGIVSESLIQTLSTEGIVLPAEVIRKGIESYTLHLEQGSSVIDAPHNEQRIAAMYRGLGPKSCKSKDYMSFDKFLLELAESKGANIIYDKVNSLEREADGIIVKTKSNSENKYDLVVGAMGLNKNTFKLFNKVCPDFIVPVSTRTHICEINLGEELTEKYFGNSMHVFLLNIPNIKFGALIPKGSHITLVLLGEEINKDIVDSFIHSEAVKKCFPPDTDLDSIITCRCYPYINVQGAKLSFSDRVVLVGDSSTSKLYKNGIGAAYLTAKAAANTAIFYGISEKDFKQNFNPTCRYLKNDNRLGRFIFAVTGVIQKTALLKRAMLSILIKEQSKSRDKRDLSSMLWDTFTGSAPYRSIILRFMRPRVILALIWNTILACFKRTKK